MAPWALHVLMVKPQHCSRFLIRYPCPCFCALWAWDCKDHRPASQKAFLEWDMNTRAVQARYHSLCLVHCHFLAFDFSLGAFLKSHLH